MEKDRINSYDGMMKGYEPSKYVNQDWPMKDGMYLQYSAFENDVQCTTGTHASIMAL